MSHTSSDVLKRTSVIYQLTTKYSQLRVFPLILNAYPPTAFPKLPYTCSAKSKRLNSITHSKSYQL